MLADHRAGAALALEHREPHHEPDQRRDRRARPQARLEREHDHGHQLRPARPW